MQLRGHGDDRLVEQGGAPQGDPGMERPENGLRYPERVEVACGVATWDPGEPGDLCPLGAGADPEDCLTPIDRSTVKMRAFSHLYA